MNTLMSKARSVGAIVLASVVYGCLPVTLKISYQYGATGINAAFWMSISGTIILAILMIICRVPFRLPRKALKKILLLAIPGSAMTTVFLYYSYTRISAGLATSLHYVYPVVIMLISVVWYHEKVTFLKITALVMTISGICIISLNDVTIDFLGILTALISGCCWAFYILFLEKSGLSKENALRVNFYLALFSIPACGILMFLTNSTKPITAPTGWLTLILAAVASRAIAGPLFQMGVKGSGPVVSSLLSTLEPITSVILGVLILNEHLSRSKQVGIYLVLSSVVIVLVSSAKSKKNQTVVSGQEAS